jgi:hypothetical protein
MSALSTEDVQAYRDRGILFPYAVLTPAEVEAALAAVAGIDEQPGERRRGLLLHKTYLVSKTLADLCRHPAILDRVESLIGGNIYVWGANFFLKEPRSSAYVSWHQDATLLGARSRRRSHRLGCAHAEHRRERLHAGRPRHASRRDRRPSRDLCRRQPALPGPEIAVDVDLDKAVDVVLQPGEMSLHHVKIAHNSEPNRSSRRRIGFAIRYVGAHVRQVSGARDRGLLVRGSDPFGHFEPEEAASGEFRPEDLARHARSFDEPGPARATAAKAS